MPEWRGRSSTTLRKPDREHKHKDGDRQGVPVQRWRCQTFWAKVIWPAQGQRAQLAKAAMLAKRKAARGRMAPAKVAGGSRPNTLLTARGEIFLTSELTARTLCICICICICIYIYICAHIYIYKYINNYPFLAIFWGYIIGKCEYQWCKLYFCSCNARISDKQLRTVPFPRQTITK